MASSPEWGKSKPRLFKRGNFHTEVSSPHPSSGEGKKQNSQGKKGLCLKVSRDQVRTPFFFSPAKQSNPLSQDRKEKEKAHATHSHALVGNQEKFICVNRSIWEQQNSPACPQDMLEFGMSQRVKGQPRGRGDALAGESAGQCRGGSL